MTFNNQINELRRELKGILKSSPRRALVLNSIALAYRAEYSKSNNSDCLEKGIEAFEECVLLAEKTSELPKYLSNLASMYFLADLRGAKTVNLREVFDSVSRAAALAALIPFQQYNTAVQWVSMAFVHEDWNQCIKAYAPLRAALRKILVVQSITQTQQFLLKDTSPAFSMVAFAAAILHDKENSQCIDHLTTLLDSMECGRTVRLSELLSEQDWMIKQFREDNHDAYKSLVSAVGELVVLQKQIPTQSTRAGLQKVYERIESIIDTDRVGFGLFANWSPITQTVAQAMVSNTVDVDAFAYIVSTSRGSLVTTVTENSVDVAVHSSPVKPVSLADFNTEYVLEENYRRYIRENESSQWPTLLREELGDLLNSVSKRWKNLSIKRVVVSPGGVFAGFPIHAAVVVDDNKTEFIGQKYLLSYAPSLRVFASLAKQSVKRLEGGYVGVGNPLPTHQELPGAELEVKTAMEILDFPDSKCIVRHEAHRQNVLFLAQNAFVLHLACHGTFSGKSHSETYLQLANDTRITLKDFLNGEVAIEKARLVVLSACHTAKTNTRVLPDEYIGLPFGVMLSGVPAVIATLWAVDDLCALVFFIKFFEMFRARDTSIASAFSSAQHWIRSATILDIRLVIEKYAENKIAIAGSDDYQPFNSVDHWAAFILFGR